MDPGDLLASVETRQDLAAFVQTLSEDVRHHPDTWQHSTLEGYFEALSAWIEVMDRVFANSERRVPLHPSWRLVGEMLLAAKYYE